MTTKERFYELDLFRFIAAFAVVIYHYCFRGFAADDMSTIDFSPLSGIAQYGFLGVELFFMISGFVILFTAQGSNVVNFTISRITRLYPAFWACLTITTIFIVILGGERYSVSFSQYLFNLSMISSVFGVEDIDGVYWTLLVEIKFYFLIFILLLINRIEQIQTFLGIWLALSIGAKFLNIPYTIEFFLIPNQSAFFIAGSLFYLIRKQGLSVFRALLLLCSYILALYQIEQDISALSAHYKTEYNYLITASILSSFFLLFLLIANKKLQSINKPAMLKLGLLTYPLYLLHQNIGYMLFNYIGDSIPKWITLGLVISLMIWLSMQVHYRIEKKAGAHLKGALTKLLVK